jgi:glycosyltransferase involved in cell wall biosynthesis
MRIAILNWSSRSTGGVERYLATLIPELRRLGHEVALWCEMDRPLDRERIDPSGRSNCWSVEELGVAQAIDKLCQWHPDLLYANGLSDPDVEERVLDVAPAVFFAHNYYGTCITGAKVRHYPEICPCSRQFGPACLFHFYPNRCGGLNPMVMAREYHRQSRRLCLLHRYRLILTHSQQMRAEYERHGLDCMVVPFAVPDDRGAPPRITAGSSSPPVWRLLFVGRMEQVKGGSILLDALSFAAKIIRSPLQLVLAGDGTERRAWERKASKIESLNTGVSVRFVGWTDREALANLYAASDLLVVPSIWPEPFGLVGVEAGRYGVPAAAFSIGGIPEWLRDGANGALAPADPPTAEGLANAIVWCLSDTDRYRALRECACALAGRFTVERHCSALLQQFATGVMLPRISHAPSVGKP